MEWGKRWSNLEGGYGIEGWADAMRVLPETEINRDKLREMEKYPHLIEALDSWVLAPDFQLLEELRKLADVVKRVYRFKGLMKLWRGVDPASSYQDVMGLAEKGFLWNTVKRHEKGDIFTYTNSHSPLSFSTNREIAQAFGKTLVSTVIDFEKADVLVITPELTKLVSQRRNLDEIETQDEVIFFPPYKLEFTIENKA